MRFLVTLGLIVSLLVVGAPGASAQTDGLEYSEDTVLTIRGDRVEVETTATMSNTTAERRRGNTIHYSYFDSLIFVLPRGVDDLSIKSRGSTLTSTPAELDGDFDVHTARLPSELRSGDRRTFTITYSLPRGEIRGDGLFFSNPAFHSFPLWSFSDPGTGSLTLRVPKDARLTEFGDGLKKSSTSTSDEFVEWVPRAFDVPGDFFTFVTITIDESLETRRFLVAGQQIELRTWPGDLEWSTFATKTIADGLPQLEELIGIPVPEQSVLEVTESVNPYFYGYAGWYDQNETAIEIGNELDTHVLVHELSHAWFNGSLFAERWMSEGLAEEFAWQAQSALSWEGEELPSTPNTSADNAVPLIEWGGARFGGVDDAEFRAREEYGYRTSWFVVREMVELIGLDGVQFMIRAASEDLAAYSADEQTETTNERDDWQRVLDLASVDATREEELALDELFTQYVVAERHVEAIAERREARDQYREFVAFPEEWAVPDDVRFEMEGWNFEDAQALMDEASEVHERYREVRSIADAAGLELSGAARLTYESNATDFAPALRVLAGQEVAIGEVEGVRQTAARELTTEEAWGLRDVSLDPYAALAVDAFATDDRDAIRDARQRLDAKLSEAARVGADRLFWAKLGAAALGVTAVLLMWMAIRRRRNKSHPHGSPKDLAGLEDQRDPVGGYTADSECLKV